MTTTESSHAQRWADQLAAWKVPDEIRDAAPDWPSGFDVQRFARIADEALEEETPSERVAREALPDGGSVLDVGCGGGAGSLPLAPPAARLIGVDKSDGMLEAFAERAAARGVDHETVVGGWPDVADQVPVTDVVVCHNVLYGVTDIRAFVHALTGHARTRVVLQFTQERPTAWLKPYWWHIHGLARPAGPTGDDAIAAIREAGYEVGVERWERSMNLDRTMDERVEFARKRLGLGPERDRELRELFERYPPPTSRPTLTLWWTPPDSRAEGQAR